MKPEDSPIPKLVAADFTPAPDPDVVDPEVIRELRQMSIPGEPDALAALARIFKSNANTDLVKLRAAIQSLNAHDVNRLAHKLKGSCGNFGAKKMFTLCQTMEKAGFENNMAGMPALLDEIEAACAELIDYLSRGTPTN